MPLKRICFLAATFLGLISIAHAETNHYNRIVGQYISGNFGGSYANQTHQEDRKENGFLGVGANLFLGDQINPYFAPEVGVAYFDMEHYNDWFSILNLNGRFTIPVGTRVSLFAKIGIGLGSVKTCFRHCHTSNDMVPTGGLGVGVGLTKEWMTSAEFNGAYFSTKNAVGIFGGLTIGATRYFAQ